MFILTFRYTMDNLTAEITEFNQGVTAIDKKLANARDDAVAQFSNFVEVTEVKEMYNYISMISIYLIH